MDFPIKIVIFHSYVSLPEVFFFFAVFETLSSPRFVSDIPHIRIPKLITAWKGSLNTRCWAVSAVNHRVTVVE